MKNLLFVLVLITHVCTAQPATITKIASQISAESLKRNLYYLASEKMEGRLMASHGDTLASLFVADWFKKHKLVAPYDKGKSYFQPITVYKVSSVDKLEIGGNVYAKSGNWMASKDFSAVTKAPVLIPFFDNPDSLIKALSTIDVKGKILIIPPSLDSKIGNEDHQEKFKAKLGEHGIAATINSGLLVQRLIENQKKHAFLPQYADSSSAFIPFKTTPSIGLSLEKMSELLSPDQLTMKAIEQEISSKTKNGFTELRTKITAEVKKSYEKTIAPNVIGLIRGRNPGAECIVVSAHHDHDGRDGKEIYYGAVDNASGTVAIMEIASLMNQAVQKGFRPKRTIVFASFTGEERGLLGSYFYVDHPVIPINKTRAIMNIDMMGRVDTLYSGRKADSTYAYILVKDSLNIGLRNALYKANETVKLNLDKHYELPQFEQRRIRGSDQFPFYKKGVPFLRIDCGFAIDYHQPTDTPDKINYPLLAKQAQLAFLTLWNVASD
jgi:hypothetical protein